MCVRLRPRAHVQIECNPIYWEVDEVDNVNSTRGEGENEKEDWVLCVKTEQKRKEMNK